MSNFEIRTYPKRELARRYFPGSSTEAAMKRLNRWISSTRGLSQAIFPTAYARHSHVFLPQQVQLLIDNFGEPEEE